jgi:hypothetical protein
VTIGERIQQLGFKRWYERSLIESHVYLVTGFLGSILAFAGVELIGQHGSTARTLLGAAAVAIGATTAAVGLQRYLRSLVFAVNLGERAVCGQCRTYAAFSVLASGPDRAAAHESDFWLRVKCLKCGHEWRI